MLLVQILRSQTLFALVLGTIIVFSYTFHRMETKFTSFGGLVKQFKESEVPAGIDSGSELWAMKDGTQRHARTEWAKNDKEIKAVLRKLDDLMPSVTFMDINTTTSAKNSKATILNYKDSYCVGEHLMVRLDLYNYLGKRKEYGGDFLRARIFSSSLNAGASGRITDYRNGTYLVNFTLFWTGNVKVSLMLIHPSEGVSALWAARKRGYDKIVFTGKFLNETLDVFTECGFNKTTNAELCEYLDERDQEAFYCVKPKFVPCEAFVQLKSNNRPISYFTAMEKRLLNSVGIEIPQNFGNIRVVPCKTSKVTRDKCRIGMASPVPSGYVLHNTWHPEFCSIHDFSTLDKIHASLKSKMIYLMGDSTSFQWIHYLTKRVTTLKYFDHQSVPVFKTHVALDLERNTFIQWKKHGYPIVTKSFYSVKDLNYIAREIDQVAGDNNTAIIVAIGQHFRPFPMDLFVRRVVNIRRAIERLLLRSPDTKVIVKAENIREMNADTERFGDFHGYAQYLAMKYIFQGLRVGVIDAWDMTIAYNTNTIHPPEQVVWSQIVMFLTYLC
ncbi:NXPE family member 2-like [Zootoca vivipara]|uniref:NXPE family member 2-like n=1 Tax=Zootoca vivipara TaxID=8524 RepID=UPI00293C0F8D|nr:NXPE family member 2-like [Zootoca vivipara]